MIRRGSSLIVVLSIEDTVNTVCLLIRTILCHTVFRCIYVPQLHSIGGI
nr:MAG TPA: hypothetical protein [Caudoviricetes sp.]